MRIMAIPEEEEELAVLMSNPLKQLYLEY